MIFLRFWKLAILYILVMAKFISKCFSEIALLAAAVLWAGCNDVNKNSGNEKSASKTSSSSSAEILNPVESTDSAALKNAEEDSLSKEPAIDSIDTNSNAAVLLDSAKQLDVKHARDSMMKAFFPVGKGNVDKDNVYAGLRCDIGNLLKRGSADRFNCIGNVGVRKVRINLSRGVFYYGVRSDWNTRKSPYFDKDFIENNLAGLLGGNFFPKLKGSLRSLKLSEIVIVEGRREDVPAVLKTVRQRFPGMRHIYNKFLKKKPGFDGTVVLNIKINWDGIVENAEITSSTTGYEEFDEELRKAVCRWTFGEKRVRGTFKIPFTFYENQN